MDINRPDILIEKNLVTKDEIESLKDDKVSTINESSYPEIYQKIIYNPSTHQIDIKKGVEFP